MSKKELWQEYDGAGRPLKNGGISAHTETKDGRWGVARVWIARRSVSGSVELLFQKRAPQVRNGGKYDASAGGHVNYGETASDAALREAKEEIGAKIDPDKLIFFSSNINENAIFFDFLYDWTGKLDEFYFDDQEVSKVRWVEFSEIDYFVQTKAKVPIVEDHLETVALLKKQMKILYGDN